MPDEQRERHTARSPKVKDCVCKSDYQDKRYGKDKRLMNPIADKKGYNWRCTVCGKEHA